MNQGNERKLTEGWLDRELLWRAFESALVATVVVLQRRNTAASEATLLFEMRRLASTVREQWAAGRSVWWESVTLASTAIALMSVTFGTRSGARIDALLHLVDALRPKELEHIAFGVGLRAERVEREIEHLAATVCVRLRTRTPESERELVERASAVAAAALLLAVESGPERCDVVVELLRAVDPVETARA